MGLDATKQSWKIGEIAELTGLSVRTLHHYDEIGLLKSSTRTESGHRIFMQDDLVRLQQILSLRQLDLSLEDIKKTLDEPDFSFLDTIVRLRGRLKQQRVHLEGVDAKLSNLEKWLTSGHDISTDRIIQILEVMAMLEKYLTTEQLETLAVSKDKLGSEYIQKVETVEWPSLIAQVQLEMQNGTDPNEPRLGPLAIQWMTLVSQFTGGDPKIAQGVRTMYENEPRASAAAGFSGVDMPKLMAYISQILTAQKISAPTRPV